MDDRERKLRNARRLRRGVVTTGVAGSLGIAGLVGLPALQHVAASTQASNQTPTRYVAPSSAARGDDGQQGEHDGWAFDDDSGSSSSPTQQLPQQQWNPPSTGFAPPTTGGGGAPHAGSMGS